MTWPTRVGLTAIHAYRLTLSPFVGGACRFHPSCSEYAEQAVREHGVAHGLWLAVRRVARCHPLTRPGIDPVPPRTAGGSR
jgi:putative membrane protein insertion efficiency factor